MHYLTIWFGILTKCLHILNDQMINLYRKIVTFKISIAMCVYRIQRNLFFFRIANKSIVCIPCKFFFALLSKDRN